MPGARYARRPLAGAPPRDPGLSPLRGPGPTSRNSKRNLREYLAITRRLPPLPTGTPAEGSIQVAGAPNDRSRIARGDPPSGKQRPYRAFARSERVRGVAAQFSAFPWALRAMQKRTCLPGSTSGTVPETLRQRHCARGAAAGGMLWARPLIRDRAPPTLAAGQPEAAWGSQGRSPSCPSLVPFLGKQERNSLSVDHRQTIPLTERYA